VAEQPEDRPPHAESSAAGALRIDIERQSVWQGPLPPPEVLREFNDIVPNGAERIVAQWESETAHRQAQEKAALAAEVAITRRGQYFAGAFAFTALAVAAWALALGATQVAALIASTTIVSVVGAFLYERRRAGS